MASTTLTASGVVREILSADLDLSADAVILKAQARGLKADVKTFREAIHNVRSKLKRGVRKPAPVPAAARTVVPARPATTPAVTVDLPAVLANVALVNQVVGTSGGVENARQVAEAVRACGGVDPFLAHLETVAGIRAAN